MPIVALIATLPAPACVSPDGGKEPIARQQSSLGSQPLSGATMVSGNYFHSCALLNTGGVACWGAGDDGQLGRGGFADSSVPVAVAGLSDAVSVSAG
ncbi:MAG TPA: hypothetical protein VNO55_24170, partial [Polyangia bacterium]|nr:hypothetical protein [Polyangia bacterium]